MTEYPILVERFQGDQSLTIVCQDCDKTDLITPDDLNENHQWPCDCGAE